MSFDNGLYGIPSHDADQEAPKRAILKPAPTCFTIEVLAPAKHGKAHSFGVRVVPVNPRQFQMMRDSGDADDSTSIQSVGKEYDIWRRWDDCLDFQDKLEAEYDRMSREKKRGLKHGKKDSGEGGTLYKNPKAGASFESLPEGPDPKSIKVDLHAHVPRLTKKSSFFSVSDATVQKRAEEVAAMIYALFKMDCPKLIEELRDSTTVRDFFGWWRRDQDLQDKSMPSRPASAMSRTRPGPGPSPSRASMDGSSVFTTPPSPDSPGFSMLKRQEKPYVHPQRSPTKSETSSIITSPSSRTGPLPSPPTSPEQPAKRSRSPMPFRGRGMSPQLQISRPMAHPQYNDMGMLSPPHESPRARSPNAPPRSVRIIGEREAQQIRAASLNRSNDSSDSSSTPPVTPTRTDFSSGRGRERPTSIMSIESIDSADFNIDLSFIKLEPAPGGKGRSKRDSVASFASVDTMRTTNSAHGVLPDGLRRRTRVSQQPRRRRDGPWSPDERLSVAVPEEDESVFYHSDDSQEDADPFALEVESAFDDTMSYLGRIDEFPDVPGYIRRRSPEEGDSDSAAREYIRDRNWRMSFPSSVRESMLDPDFEIDYDALDAPSSPTSTIMPSDSGHSTYSNETVKSLPPELGMCSVKAKLNDVIVALRLPVGTPLSTLRARVSEKFVQAQGVQLHYRFSIAYIPPRSTLQLVSPGGDGVPFILSPAAQDFAHSSNGRPQSVRPETMYASAPLMRLMPIWSQDDWDEALRHCNNKIVLHVIDQEVR